MAGRSQKSHSYRSAARYAGGKPRVGAALLQIGNDILTRQAKQGWGAKVIERLAQDLRAAFPEMRGFSPRNLKYMRAFAEAWPDVEFVQQAAAQLPWGHNLVLLDKLPGPETRRWYTSQAIKHNWSRNVLVIQIEARLLHRTVPPSACCCARAKIRSSPNTLCVITLGLSVWLNINGSSRCRQNCKPACLLLNRSSVSWPVTVLPFKRKSHPSRLGTNNRSVLLSNGFIHTVYRRSAKKTQPTLEGCLTEARK